jgi:hypothetical protein
MFVPETKRHEAAAIDEVYERLRHRFSALDDRVVGSAVYGAAREFSTARVRDFVPVLVEHVARERLASRQAVPRPRSAPGPGVHRRRP